MSDWPWVGAAYTLTWLVLGVYALVANRRLARARAELENERANRSTAMEVK